MKYKYYLRDTKSPRKLETSNVQIPEKFCECVKVQYKIAHRKVKINFQKIKPIERITYQIYTSKVHVI